MRRKVRPPTGTVAGLMDLSGWKRCTNMLSRTEQPCTCWFSEQQRAFVDAGGEWPGGGAAELTDLFTMYARFPCNPPFDPSTV